MTTTEHLCDLKCGRPAPTTTICQDCEDEPRRELNIITKNEIDRLYAIARGEERPAETAVRNSHDNANVADVLNLHAYVLAHAIDHEYPRIISSLASHPKATEYYWRIINDCEQAQSIINGNDIEYTPERAQQIRKELDEPLPTRELIDWLWERFRVSITPMQIRHWANRGRLTPAEGTGKQHKKYAPRDVLEILG